MAKVDPVVRRQSTFVLVLVLSINHELSTNSVTVTVTSPMTSFHIGCYCFLRSSVSSRRSTNVLMSANRDVQYRESQQRDHESYNPD